MSSHARASLQIRSANEADVPLLLNFIRQLATYERLDHEVVATEECLRHSLFQRPSGAEAVIGELQGRPVAFALYYPTYSTFLGCPGLHLEDLFVLPEARGRGHGAALFTHVAKIAHDRGYARLEWSVLDWNRDAIGFYQKLGAVPLNDWTVFRLAGDALLRLGNPA